MTSNATRTPKQLFKAAFLLKCAECGLTLEETKEAAQTALRTIKTGGVFESAVKPAVSAASGIVRDTVSGVVKPVTQAGLAGLLLGPPALGLAGGYGLAKMTDIDDTDVEEIRNQALIEEYQRQTERLRSRRKERNK